MSDDGVSELLGYSLLVGIVITAVVGLSTGAAGLIETAAGAAAQSNAEAATEAFARTVSLVAAENNTYGTVLELVPPVGYRLGVADEADDYRSVRIFAGSEEKAAVRTGSLELGSAFRRAAYEGGAVTGGDAGLGEMLTPPTIFLSGSGAGRLSLYVCLISLSGETWVARANSPVALTIRCLESRTYEWSVPPGTATGIAVKTAEPEAWKAYLERAGFSVATNGETVTASIGGVSDVHVSKIVVRVDR